MLKKLAVAASAGAVALATIPMFAAFEAHVINVTARIENALQVNTEPIEFGTVFPQEFHELGIFVTFSESFSSRNQTRVTKVDYVIKQKPKPRPEFENVVGVTEAREWCHDNYPTEPYPGQTAEGIAAWQSYLASCYPSLCPFLSKTPANLDRNDVGVLPFHDPWTTFATGSLNKVSAHVGDNWVIDLPVPCFKGHCAQDWPSFVREHNPTADPNAYMLPAELEHEVFGCDLWVEVTRIY